MTSPATRLAAKPCQWQPIAPADAGFASDLEARFDRLIAEKRVWNLHGVVVVRDGRPVLERYFEGEDRMRGVGAVGYIAFKDDTLHDMRSVSKGIVALLYGIALEQGKVPPPDAPLFSAFPEYADLATHGRERLTIHHVLTMTMGTEWDESSLPYSDPANSEIAMDNAPDRYRYVLERPVVRPPGKRWTYCGGATALLSHIIARGTGRPLRAFAREALLDPLGIGPTEWASDAKGEPYAASGLRMTPRDLARIGVMMAGGGMAGGTQVVPAQWLERCTTPVVGVDGLRRYGYQWYVSDVAYGEPLGWAVRNLEPMWGAMGEGGQRLFVLPELQLVIAITAGNYGAGDQWIPPTRVLIELVLPSLA
jgi:CubicO group peptidase (beta-lactamase class C family)